MNTFLYFILFLISLASCSPNPAPPDSPCTKVLKQINSEIEDFVIDLDPKDLSNVTRGFTVLSGRFINDFGEYDLCQNFTQNYYLSLLFTGNLSGSTFDAMVGFCAPTNCSIKDCEDNTDLIHKLYYKGMSLPLASLAVKNTTTYYDPKSPAPGDLPTTVIIAVVLLSIVLLVLSGTVLGVFWEIKQDKRSQLESIKFSADQNSDLTSENANKETRITTPVNKHKHELTGIFKLLDCFDARKNFEKLVKVKYTSTYDFNLEVFNGIRVLMMLWVVLGHTFLFGTNYIDNLADISTLGNDWRLLVPNAALYAVDVFFYMGGFLFAYIGLEKLKKMKPNVVNFFGLAVHRFLRIWPTYIVAVIFFWRILPLLGEGPIWFKMTNTTALCDGTVWMNFFLVDDLFVQSADYCFGWGWYLSNDFQMFLVTPIILWLYIRNPKAGKLCIVIVMTLSYILALFIGINLHVRATPPKAGGITNPKAFSQYYVKPYIRIPPYLIGVLFALVYKEYKQEKGSSFKFFNYIKQSKFLKNLIPFLGLSLLLILTFLPRQVQIRDDAWPDWFHIFWRTFQKSLYVVGLTMLLLPSLLGDTSLFKRFLCHPLLVPLARMSFTAYLVHLFWVYQSYINATASFHFTYGNVTLNTVSNGVASFGIGFLLSLLIEVPMANIEAVYMGPKKKAVDAKKHDNEKPLLNGKEKQIANGADNSSVVISNGVSNDSNLTIRNVLKVDQPTPTDGLN